MDFQKLTIKSQEAVGSAMEMARRRGNPEVYPEHLCLALLDQELPRTLLERAGVSVDSQRQECEARLSAKPAVAGASQQPHASTAFAEVLDRAEEEMRELETSSSRPSTYCSRSTSLPATGCSTRSSRCAAPSE